MERVIFIHIPKAAGSTVRNIVARQYRPEEIVALKDRVGHVPSLPLEKAAQARIILGHVHYGIHEQLPGSSTYVTLLRDPVSRVASLYRYILSNKKHHLHVEASKVGLLEFIQGDLDRQEIENGQTRQIAGLINGWPDHRTLDQAKQNMKEAFGVVGVMELFDQSLVLLKRRLGWKRPFYARMNVAKDSGPPPTEEVVESIRERNLLDIELYEFARLLMDQSIRRESPSFAREVAIFRALNRAAQALSGTRNWSRGH
jgi:hypothetical protein